MSEHRYTGALMCPHCDHVDRDPWDHEWGGCEGTIVVCCGRCDRDFVASRYCRVSYNSRPVDRGDGGEDTRSTRNEQ